MNRHIKKLVPLPVSVFIETWKDRVELNKLKQIPCDTSPISEAVGSTEVRKMLSSENLAKEFCEAEREIGSLSIGTEGGINLGDRRALYYLLRHFRPSKVLEVGTHIGASTVSILAALRQRAREAPTSPGKLVTVDIRDVNDRESRPWVKYKSKNSPREMSQLMGSADRVQFVVSTSISYLSGCTERFDFIFLDGSHSATSVYQEVPLALNCLNDGGVILLHDYFPELKPLWSDGNVIPGPWLATKRLESEGAGLAVLPLGELPWMTKLNSKVSSLALLHKVSRS